MTRLVTVARPYAKAIIMSATTAEEQTAWSSVLSYLSLMVQDAQIGELLKNPGISRAKIKNIFFRYSFARLRFVTIEIFVIQNRCIFANID